MNRYPIIGDLIVVKPCPKRYKDLSGFVPKKSYEGVVYDIKKGSVKLMWSGDVPPNYNPKFGYLSVNIHNLRHEFKIIRNGAEVS